jgi:uncharacterized protein YprB with RNaseH-like and TPR domain
MLERTFIHVPGIGQTTERRLWEAGVREWQDALGLERKPLSFSEERWRLVRDTLTSSVQSLNAGDHRHFAGLLAARDHWRAFPDFQHRAAYVDIETTGCTGFDMVTVIGVYDGVRTRQYVAGDNMDQFPADIDDFSLLVTFNGACFDLPFLRQRFPGLDFHQLHIDLRYPLASLGLKGGLKAIEKRVGLARGDAIDGMDGWDAVRLWHEYRQGREASLELLLEYNRADIENLAVLVRFGYERLWERLETGPACAAGK